MGLFNYIRIEQELPLDATLKTLNHNWRDEEYQTKELEENAMITYILRDNKLFELVEEGHFEEVSSEQQKEDDSKFGFIWDRKYVKDSSKEVWRENYTGTFSFGCVVYGDNIDANDFYPDWRCVVVNGVVKELTIIPEYTKLSSIDRIEQQMEWDKEIETHKNKMKCPVYSFYFNYYVKPMDKFSWYLVRKLYFVTKFVEWIRFAGIRKVTSFLNPR
jgi:hypothetical protein